jgi:hypothetical protein
VRMLLCTRTSPSASMTQKYIQSTCNTVFKEE